MTRNGVFAGVALLLTMVLLGGCATVSNPSGIQPRQVDPSQRSLGEGTGIGSQDLQAVSDKMARSILDTTMSPDIAGAIATGKPVVVTLLPVRNDTRFPINKQLFTMRLKALLNTNVACKGKVLFAARDRVEAVERERDLKRQGLVGSTPGKEGNIAGADFFLTGELTGLSQASSTGQSDYVLYTFRLINAETSIEVWEDMAEIKKEGLEDAAYR